MVFVVPPESRGARLDLFVVAALAGSSDPPSREEVKRWIHLGLVRVEGRPKRASEKLREGQTVEVERAPPSRSRAVPEAGIDFAILHVDDAVVVVNKPPGLVVHPARGHEGGTLVNGLLARGLFDAGEADARDPAGHLRPGIVHRLDKGTSGVLVVARTALARERLKEQFAAHTIERAYEAICDGEVTLLRHATLHGRHPTDRLRFTTHVRTGKRAVTDVIVKERFGALGTWVVCRLETGRTHQIRVHMAESGTPILGDPLYGAPPKDPGVLSVAEALGHQALHARVLGFVHPTTRLPLRFEAPPPDDFRQALAALGRLSRPPT